MNVAIVLAAGVGQRMRNGGLPKQFLKLMGKPIIIYTLEKFDESELIDHIIVVCHGSYVEYMQSIISMFHIKKDVSVIVGGKDRQSSVMRGLDKMEDLGAKDDDLVIIHDGVRPLISQTTISENIRAANTSGAAITVRPVTETVIVTEDCSVHFEDFMKRSDTYSLTSPQTFRFQGIKMAFQDYQSVEAAEMPLLDAAMVYAKTGKQIDIVKDQNPNLKVTTPEDFYYLRALLELEENRYIFGI